MEFIKNIFSIIRGIVLWFLPLAVLLIVTYLPKIFWNIDFKNYLEFLRILIWPCTALIILFFFQKVVTYLFFSMNEFNFFGAKGNLKNVNEVIMEEVNKKFIEKENEEKRKLEIEELNGKIDSKETELRSEQGSARENLDLAKELLRELKKTNTQLAVAEKENRRLRDMLSPSPIRVSDEDSGTAFLHDENRTSDSTGEESSNNN